MRSTIVRLLCPSVWPAVCVVWSAPPPRLLPTLLRRWLMVRLRWMLVLVVLLLLPPPPPPLVLLSQLHMKSFQLQRGRIMKV